MNKLIILLFVFILIAGCSQPKSNDLTNNSFNIKELKIINNQVKLGEDIFVYLTIKGVGVNNITLYLDNKVYDNKVVSLNNNELKIGYKIISSLGQHQIRVKNITKNFTIISINNNENNNLKDKKELIFNNNFTYLEYFPVDIDYLKNNIDRDNLRENTISGTVSLISPFIYHFGVGHVEGTGKIYIYSPNNKNMLIVSPANALIDKTLINDVVKKNIETINKEEVYQDVDNLILLLDKNKYIRLGHIWMLKSLVDKIINSKDNYYLIKSGTPIGYNNKDWAFDYYFYDNEVDNGPNHLQHFACPINYYNKTMQDKINSFYNEYIYSDMIVSGKWPESKLCGGVNININNSVWGEWYYKSGFKVVNENSHWYNFKNGLLVFFNKDFVNNETFNRLWNNKQIDNECPNWNGFYLGLNDDFTDGENFIGACVINTSDSNILELKQFGNNSNTIKYFRFKILRDEMQGEFFNNLNSAKSGFINPTIFTKIEKNASHLN